jgi:hydrogenase nickel incorporation protein HypB
VIVTKTDMSAAAGFDRELALKNIRQASPRATVFELSARTGDGVMAWCDYLVACKSDQGAGAVV